MYLRDKKMQHVLGSLDNNPLLMDYLIKKQVGISTLPFMGMDSKYQYFTSFRVINLHIRIGDDDLRSVRNKYVHQRFQLSLSPRNLGQACCL